MTNLLYKILLEEVNIRNANKLKDFKKISRLKQLAFDETRITEGLKWQLSKLKEFDIASNKQNIFIVGDCSIGKTLLASTLGMNALEKGDKVIYIKLIIDDVFYIAPTEEELVLIYKILMFL